MTVAVSRAVSGTISRAVTRTITGTLLVRAIIDGGSDGTAAEDGHEETLGIILGFDFLRLFGIGFAVALALVFQHLDRLFRRRLLGDGALGDFRFHGDSGCRGDRRHRGCRRHRSARRNRGAGS